MKSRKKPSANGLSELRRIADSLPRMIKKDQDGNVMRGAVKKVHGKRLLKAGIKEHYGKAVEKNKMYRMRKVIYVDHYPALLNHYSSFGNKGVKDYMRHVRNTVWNDLSFKLKVMSIGRLLLSSVGIIKRKPARAGGSPNK